MKKQLSKPIWKRCFTFALAAALAVQMIGTPTLTAFAADDTAAAVSASDLKQEETPAEETAVEEKTVEAPAAEKAAEEVSAPALKAAPAAEAEKADAVTYLDADGSVKTVTNYTVMTSSISTMNAGWYVVKSNVTVKRGHVTVKGDVKLILCNDTEFTGNGALGVTSGNSLTIYAQTTDEAHIGKLTVNDSKQSNYAPLGGENSSKTAGTITINGGKITATLTNKSRDGAAIGGFGSGGAGTITINGGIVTADASISNGTQAAIGFGDGGKGGTVTINGGQVSARGPSGGCGIGADSISLSYTNSIDSIYASSYSPNPTLEKDFILDGTDTDATPANAGGNTIVPKPVPVTYTVVFYNWDGTEISRTTVQDGEYPEFPDMSDYDPPLGYNFSEGWNDKETGVPFADTDVITSDRELIAGLKPISYQIAYNLDDGNAEGNPVNYTVETETFTLVNPTKEGYDFTGWSGTGIEGTSMAVTIEQGSTGDREYTANWVKAKYTVTFDTDEGSELKVFAVEEVDEDENTQGGDYINSGAEVEYGTVLEITATAKTGYELTESPKDTVKVTGNTTLTVRSQKKIFALTVAHENGADPVVSCSDYPVDAIPYGTEVTVTAGNANEGFEFIGFYRPNGVLLGSEASYTFAMTANTTIEARYQQIGKIVTFMSNGQVFETKTCDTFTVNDFPKNNPPAIDGYKFIGWSMDAEEINAALQNGNVTVQAEFEAVTNTFTVVIYNGEKETPEEVVCEKSTLITRTAEKVNGKVFAYWTITRGTKETILSYNTKASLTATENCTLKAVYSEEAVEALGTATIRTAKYNMDTRRLTFNAYLTVPDNTTIVAAGLVAAQEGNFTGDLTTENAQFNKSLVSAEGKCAPVNYTWNKTNVNPDDVWCVRAHLVYTENGTNKEIYGPLITVRAGTDYDYTEKGTAVLRTMSYNKDSKVATFNVYLTVPDNATIVKAGLVAASSNSTNFNSETEMLTSSNADYCKSLASAVGKCAPVNYTWNKTNVNEDWYVRAWLVYDLDGVRHTVYGDQELFKLASYLE